MLLLIMLVVSINLYVLVNHPFKIKNRPAICSDKPPLRIHKSSGIGLSVIPKLLGISLNQSLPLKRWGPDLESIIHEDK